MGLDPASMLLIGTLISAGGSVVEGFQQNKIAKANARAAEQEADMISAKSAAEQSKNIRENRRRMATQIAQVSALGADIGAGTSLKFAEESAEAVKLEQLDIATGNQIDRRSRLIEAENQRATGRAALTRGILGGAGRAISGGARFLAA